MSSSVTTPPTTPPRTTPGPSLGLVRGLAIANLIGQITIILTGGIVRLTGSGLGCSTWPQCEPGTFTPEFYEAVSYHPYVEFGNRLVTFVLTAIGVALLWAVWKSPALWFRPRSLRWLAASPLIGVLAQAVLGGILVLLELPPALVGLHFLVSAALVWLSALLVVRLSEGDERPTAVLTTRGIVASWVRAVPTIFAVVTSAVVILGVITTGSGPHSGDEEVGYRLALDPVQMSKIHAGAVWVFVACVLVTLAIVASSRAHDPVALRRARASWWALLAVTLAQGGIGYAQYFEGLPVPLVALHLLGSAILVAATTFAVLSLRGRGPLPMSEPTPPVTYDHVFDLPQDSPEDSAR